MSKIRCQAKDPSTCSYHSPNAGAIQLVKLNKATSDFETAKKAVIDDIGENPAAEYFDTKMALEEAENAYYATADGLKALELELKATKDPIDVFRLKDRIELANYQVNQAELQNNLDNVSGGSITVSDKFTYEVPKYKTTGDSLWPETTGSKYDSTFTTRQIATNLTADFKKAQKEGYLPKHLKFKVSPSSSSRSVGVTIIGATDKQIYDEVQNNNGYAVRSSRAAELEARVEAVTNAYNWKQYDKVEGRINNTKYWSRVGFESPSEKAYRIQKETASLRKREAKQQNL